MSLAVLIPRALLLALLVWQAGASVAGEVASARRTADRSWSTRLGASTDARVAAVLGADVRWLAMLREHAPAGTLVCTESVQGDLATITPERFAQLNHENGVLVQLQALLYPAPKLLVRANARAEAEVLAGRGRAVLLWVRAGGVEPADGAGWTRVHVEPGASLWRPRQH